MFFRHFKHCCSIPREIYQFALLNNSAAIIVLHNHPSGDTTPSEADIDFTKQLNMAGTLIDIDFLDHIIVSDSEYTSVREKRPDVFDVCSNSRLELFVADGNEHYSKNRGWDKSPKELRELGLEP